MAEDALTAARVFEVLAEYLRRVELATQQQRRQILDEHPDLREDLETYFQAVDQRGAAGRPDAAAAAFLMAKGEDRDATPEADPTPSQGRDDAAATPESLPLPVSQTEAHPPEIPQADEAMEIVAVEINPRIDSAERPFPNATEPPPDVASRNVESSPDHANPVSGNGRKREPASEGRDHDAGPATLDESRLDPDNGAAASPAHRPKTNHSRFADPPEDGDDDQPSADPSRKAGSENKTLAGTTPPAAGALDHRAASADALTHDGTANAAPEPPPTPPTVDLEETSSPRAWLRRALRETPAWLVSVVVHLAALLILALLLVPARLLPEVRDVMVSTAEEEHPLDEEVDIVLEDVDLEVSELTFEAVEAEAVSESLDDTAIDEVAAAETTLEVAEVGFDIAPLTDLAGESAAYNAKGLSGRSAANRRAMAMQRGGTPESEAAVEAALKWFAAHQNPDGGWSFQHQLCPACAGQCANPGNNTSTTGATGMVLLCFLGAGESHQQGKYQAVVERGLYHLLNQMKVTPDGGDLQGAGKAGSLTGANSYCHGIATIALCEAYAMSRDKRLWEPAQAAVNFIVNFQDPVGGGWRYSKGASGDLSVTGFQLMALKSGHLAYLQVPPRSVAGAVNFLDKVSASGGAQYGYTGPTNPFKGGYGGAVGLPSTTAIGLLGRMYTGWPKQHPAIAAGVAYLSTTGPSTTDMYYNYYATMVLSHWGGYEWKQWNGVMRDFLVRSQVQQGHETGSWKPFGAWGSYGGRLMDTAFCCMTLEVYYRYMPLYKESAGKGF